jgi:hypothetical protein
MGVVAFFTAITREQLATFLDDPDSLRAFEQHDRSFMDIDKAHEGIVCLLERATKGRTKAAVRNAIFGGHNTAVMAAYGPVRYLTPEEVVDVANALSRISADDLRAVYSPEALCKVDSLTSWLWNDIEAGTSYLVSHYQRLVKFYQTAARENKAVLQSEV